MENKNIIPHQHKIQKIDRIKQKGTNPLIIWFTGLSGSGKSTLASELEKKLFELNYHTYILDGDNIRSGLNKGLTFSDEDRVENIRRIGEVAKLFLDANVIVLTAFISPFRADRQQVRNLVEEGEFVEVWVDCPLEVCEQRDVKGLYKKARAGEIKNFTGIDSPFETPQYPEVVVNTANNSLDVCVSQLLEIIQPRLKSNN